MRNKSNILFLGNRNNTLYEYLSEKESVKYIGPNTSVNLQFVEDNKIDYIISYGYKKIITKDIVEKYKGKIINLHISYLPWNRGASPNVWSFIENTPKGVSIHYIDDGIDTGDILLQKIVHFEDLTKETFKTTYVKLCNEIEKLFISNWKNIKNQNIVPVKQILKEGSFHTVKQSSALFNKMNLDNNWDKNVVDFMNFKRQDEDIINDIQNIRTQNNTHWMDVVKLAFREAPEEARSIFKKIKFCDHKVNQLLEELSEND